MSEEEKKEELENPEEEEEPTSPEGENPEEKSVPEKTEDKSEEIQRRDAQIKHWRDKAEKAEKELKDKGKTETEQKPTKQKPDESLEEWKNRVEFRARHSDYSDEEFEHISQIAKEKGISLKEAAESEKDYIDFQRSKVAKESNAPEPSNKQVPAKKSPKDVSSDDLKNMSMEEKEEYFKSIGAGVGAGVKRRRTGNK